MESQDAIVFEAMRHNVGGVTPRLALYFAMAGFRSSDGWQQLPVWTLIDQNSQARRLLTKLQELDLKHGRGRSQLALEDMHVVCASIDWTSVKMPARQCEAERLLRQLSADLEELEASCLSARNYCVASY